MPGLVGMVTPNMVSDHSVLKNKFAKICSNLESNPRFKILHDTGHCTVALLERDYGPLTGPDFSNDRGFCSLYGHCYDRRSGSPVSSKSFLTLWQEQGPSFLEFLEGAFHVVMLDFESGVLRIINDRVGTLPMYYHQSSKGFSFAPRLRYLARSQNNWDPAPGAIINFLSVGHYLGSSTQVKQAKFLAPSTILEVNQTSLEYSESRYWNLVYEPDNDLSTKEHCTRLGESIFQATDLLTPVEAGRAGIFLSGGWDSRSLLGASRKLNRPPHLAITNGMSDDIKFSDTWLAKKMATDFGIPYKFCSRSPNAGQALWLDGIHSGEITTTNNPENFGNHQLDSTVFSQIDYILKGDVTWGSGDKAPTRELSIGKIVPYPLMDKVKTVLNSDLAAEADALYEKEIDGVLRHCTNEDWTDRRDYLWQMGGINRYILGLGSSDEEHIQVRRPLLCGSVFDVYTKVPRNLRVQKNLFIQSVKQCYPEEFSYGRNFVSNIANYYFFMADFVRARTLDHLDAGHDLGGLLDAQACRLVLESFHPEKGSTWQPGIKAQLYHRFHDNYSQRWHRTRFYKEKDTKRFATSDTMLAFHLYLLLEWFHGSR